MIEINNLTNFAVDKKSFSQVAKIVLKGENRERENISLAFIGKAEIKKLNKKFRKKNKPTDVLSFLLNEKQCFGEIIICPEVVKQNAKKYGVSAQAETLKVFVHGILHLCGYDHEKSDKEAEIMEAKEKRYLNNLKFTI
jgi:probable rRNA maturation factor